MGTDESKRFWVFCESILWHSLTRDWGGAGSFSGSILGFCKPGAPIQHPSPYLRALLFAAGLENTTATKPARDVPESPTHTHTQSLSLATVTGNCHTTELDDVIGLSA